MFKQISPAERPSHIDKPLASINPDEAKKTKDNSFETPENKEVTPANNIENNEKITALEELVKTIKDNEKIRFEQRFGKGWWGKVNHWFNNTEKGKMFKISAKVILGGSAVASVALLSGGTAIYLAPLLYGAGSKNMIDGAIEAVQYFAKGGRNRLKMEVQKQNTLLELKAKAELRLKNKKTDKSPDDLVFKPEEILADLVGRIKKCEEEVISDYASNIKTEKSEKKWRTIISSAVTIGFGLVNGIPLGLQDFNKKDAAHHVFWSLHKGLEFVYNAGEKMAQSPSFNLIGTTHAMGKVGTALVPKELLYGPATAIIGAFLKEGKQLAQKGWQKVNIGKTKSPVVVIRGRKNNEKTDQEKSSSREQIAEISQKEAEKNKLLIEKIKDLEEKKKIKPFDMEIFNKNNPAKQSEIIYNTIKNVWAMELISGIAAEKDIKKMEEKYNLYVEYLKNLTTSLDWDYSEYIEKISKLKNKNNALVVSFLTSWDSFYDYTISNQKKKSVSKILQTVSNKPVEKNNIDKNKLLWKKTDLPEIDDFAGSILSNPNQDHEEYQKMFETLSKKIKTCLANTSTFEEEVLKERKVKYQYAVDQLLKNNIINPIKADDLKKIINSQTFEIGNNK